MDYHYSRKRSHPTQPTPTAFLIARLSNFLTLKRQDQIVRVVRVRGVFRPIWATLATGLTRLSGVLPGSTFGAVLTPRIHRTLFQAGLFQFVRVRLCEFSETRPIASLRSSEVTAR